MVEHQAEVVRWLTRRCHNLQREVLRLSLARETCAPSICTFSHLCRPADSCLMAMLRRAAACIC